MSSCLPTKSLACALVALALAVPARAAPALTGWGSLPVSFEPNRGQTHASVDFIARSRDGVGFLAGGALTLRFGRCAQTRDCRTHAVRMSLAGARLRKPEGLEPLPGVASYFLGSDPSRWIAGIPTYGQVLYREVMPGVDLRYHSSERHLELDIVLAPGASPDRLRLTFDGADRVAVDPKGDLLLTVADRSLTLRRPVAYQEIAGERRAVDAQYVVKGKRAVAIALGERDRSRPVVVDPVLVYSARMGGAGDDALEAVAVDPSGAAYATGWGIGFPVSKPYGPGGSYDAVVLKLNPGGTALEYSAYLGGMFSDYGYGIAVDSAGNAVVAGETTSPTDFPRLNALQNTFGGGLSDVFVARLNPAGTQLVYSTFVGGNGSEGADAVVLDGSGNAYITGGTQSNDWATTAGAYQTGKAGGRDAFVLKVSPSGTRTYSTYLGGQQEDSGRGIAVNGAGQVFVAGSSLSPAFPGTGPGSYQPMPAGASDAFVFGLSAAGNQALFSTFLGGSGDDEAQCLALTPGGDVLVGGNTVSSNFPTPGAAFDKTHNGGSDAFVAQFTTGGALVFSTFLGGSGADVAYAIAQGATGGPWVAGRTQSVNFPIAGTPVQSTEPGSGDAFITQLNSSGSGLDFSTYLGASGDDDYALGLAIDIAGGAYVVGARGTSTAFPTPAGSYQSAGLLTEAFAAKLREPFTLASITPDAGTIFGGTQVTLTGTKLTENMTVSFGGSSVGASLNAGALIAITPSHGPGPVDVEVVALDGTKSNTLIGGYTYVLGLPPDGGADGGGGDGGADGGEEDSGVPDGGGPGGQVDLLGCSCASGVSGSTALAFVLVAAIAARARPRQRRRPTSAPPSQ